MFSADHLIIKIQYGHYNFLPSKIYITCTFDPKEFCSNYRINKEKDGYNDLLLKLDGIAECKLDPTTNHFTITLQKQ
jgi:hypothetical protein